MSCPIVSSMWLFPFTGRQRRYSLRAARYTRRVDSTEASGSMSPTTKAMGEGRFAPNAEGEGEGEVGEGVIVVVAGPVAGQLAAPDPPGDLLEHLARLTFAALAEQPADARPAHPARIAQQVHPPGQRVVDR